MKPIDPIVKHKKSASYSILLLRDDSSALRFKLNSFWIKFLVFFFVVFSGVSGASGYAAHYYWKKYNNLQRERDKLQADLTAKKHELSEIAGVKVVSDARRQPRSSMVDLAALGATTSDAQNGAENGGSTTTVETGAVLPGNGANSRHPENATTPTEQNGGNSDAANATIDDDGHPVAIDKVHIRAAGGKSYKLSYELSNRERDKDQNQGLVGKIEISVATKSGSQHDIASVSGDPLAFSIKWGKRVDVVFSLPSGVSQQDADKLLLTAKGKNFPVITYPFPMPQQ